MSGELTLARRGFHKALIQDHTLSLSAGVASNADADQRTSTVIAAHVARKLGARTVAKKLAGQRAGKQFEEAAKAGHRTLSW